MSLGEKKAALLDEVMTLLADKVIEPLSGQPRFSLAHAWPSSDLLSQDDDLADAADADKWQHLSHLPCDEACAYMSWQAPGALLFRHDFLPVA